ncbi:hypothetical protein RhiirA1_529248 [Rhizophagus irregularis]|uniref:Uncharacterized protein n=1 Tax=Rhizophagus irregularis TaxID=588596 RepID=A0A2N0SGZ9_9GLOM|nr:hypothetical protein RhiirA1_529248 [Rhizophagus irregularis]CAB4477859.1 unnamed protein product [Rhizophagus irregularis]CAB5215537.1 unnamed protein product [Rhizophagus irregularis]
MDISIAEQFDINDKEWSLSKCKQFLKVIQNQPSATSIEKEPSDENHVFLPKYLKSVVEKDKKFYKWVRKELDDIFIAIFRFLHEYYPEINKYQLNANHNEKISQWNNSYSEYIGKNKVAELQNQFISESNSEWIPGFKYLYDFEKYELTFVDNHGILAIVLIKKKWNFINIIDTKYRKFFMEEIEKDPRIMSVIFIKPKFGSRKKKGFPWDIDKKMWNAIKKVNKLNNKNSVDSDQKTIAQTIGVETLKELESEDVRLSKSLETLSITDHEEFNYNDDLNIESRNIEISQSIGIQIQEEFLKDHNVRDIFFGSEKVEVPPYSNKKLYVVVDRTPKKPLRKVGDFPIVYIEWRTFTELGPRDYPPSMALPQDVKKKFDDILDTQLGLEFRSLFSNLTAISLDWKIVGGFYTNRPAIVFYVIRKGVIPIGDMLFPEAINDIETDVREGFYEMTGNYSKDCRKYLNYVSTGCSIGISGTTRAGTLGAFVKGQNDITYLLTNDHVIFSNDQKIICQPADEDHTDLIEKDLKHEKEKLEKLQPQPETAKLYNTEKEEILTQIKRLEEDLEKARNKNTQFAIYEKGLRENHRYDNRNYGVDAAIASLKPGIRPPRVNHFAIRGPVFEDMSIDPSIRLSGFKDVKSVDSSEPIFKVGRTSGLTEGHIKEIDVSVKSSDGFRVILVKQSFIFHGVLMEEIKVQGINNFPPKWLDRQILVKSKGDDSFMKGGDSGCVWFDKDDKDGKMIALGHGSICLPMGNYAVGSPINAVFNALDVNPIFNN